MLVFLALVFLVLAADFLSRSRQAYLDLDGAAHRAHFFMMLVCVMSSAICFTLQYIFTTIPL